MDWKILKTCGRIMFRIGGVPLNRTNCKQFSTTPRSTKRLSVNDPEFSEHLKQKVKEMRKNPWLLIHGYANLLGEFKKLYEENINSTLFTAQWNAVRDSRASVDMLYTFQREQDLQQFEVFSDATLNVGSSVASFKITEHGTGLFSGVINTEVKKEKGIRRVQGYAGIITERKLKSFGRVDKFDWSMYSHLVLKVRGDGRHYMITLPIPGEYDVEKFDQYAYPLFTRGGPYWQITKIPFSNFIFSPSSAISDEQFLIPLTRITKLGIMAMHKDGPFKLEIDYIGLEKKWEHRSISPYEQYYIL